MSSSLGRSKRKKKPRSGAFGAVDTALAAKLKKALPRKRK